MQVVIDAFRTINPQLMMLGAAPRQTTSNLGHLRKPSIQALIHNLNRHYYSINIDYRKNELEQKMLLNLHKKKSDTHTERTQLGSAPRRGFLLHVDAHSLLSLLFLFVLLFFALLLLLLNCAGCSWTDGLTVKSAVAHAASNESTLSTMMELAKQYHKRLEEAEGKTAEELVVLNVGKINPKRHLEMNVEALMTSNITQTLGLMLSTVVF